MCGTTRLCATALRPAQYWGVQGAQRCVHVTAGGHEEARGAPAAIGSQLADGLNGGTSAEVGHA